MTTAAAMARLRVSAASQQARRERWSIRFGALPIATAARAPADAPAWRDSVTAALTPLGHRRSSIKRDISIISDVRTLRAARIGSDRIVRQVRIDFGGAGLIVPEHLADQEETVAVGDGERREAVPQIVDAHPARPARALTRSQSSCNPV
jgi:hypothetical protein